MSSVYPQTMVKVVDNSTLNPINIADTTYKPVFFQAFTADKGPEEFGIWSGEEWYKMFGYNLDFSRHGQALKQCGRIINAGGAIYSRRFCAPDSKLANLGIYVKVITVATKRTKKDPITGLDATDSNGDIIYLKLNPDATGEEDKYLETTDSSEADSFNSVTLRYGSAVVDTTSNNMEDLAEKFLAACPSSSPNSVVLPLFIIAPQGRGTSNLRFRVTPSYRYSRNYGYGKYLFEVLENGETLESTYFAMQPNKIENNYNVSLEMSIYRKSNQVRCIEFDENIKEMYNTIEEILGYNNDELANTDFMFGCTLRGKPIDGIMVDTSDFNLQSIYGNPLQGGSNGSFGNAPLKSPLYEQELLKCYNGEYDEEIYNLDSAQIDIILDANYPETVKRAIENFVTFREDCFFMRDMGLEAASIDEFEAQEADVLHNRYSSSYCNHMITYDPDTKKRIRVTITYLLAGKLVSHFINGRNRAFAGQQYGVYFSYGKGTDYTVEKGSVNFIPKVTPSVNEKQILVDMGVNYCSIYNGNRLVVETVYTAQHIDIQTQLSFSNNVWAIQQVIKGLRVACPKSRYSFIDTSGLALYEKDIRAELNKYSNNFTTYDFEYQYDADYESQKVYYAILAVRFRDFAQAEYFKIIVLPNS